MNAKESKQELSMKPTDTNNREKNYAANTPRLPSMHITKATNAMNPTR